MSIFSHIRKSRQQAKDHKEKVAEQKKKEAEQAPYRHVPTHAAVDAFASAPPSWREADRARVVEQNRRRSAMAASGHHMNMPGVPRVGSSLSRVSYPGEGVSPMVRLPRAYSYNGALPYSESRRGDTGYSTPDIVSYASMGKGKDVVRFSDSQRVSPTSSKGDPSPVESSNDSTSSQDDLEMKSSRPAPNGVEPVHRLAPRSARRLSDTAVDRQTSLGASAKALYPPISSRDSRPPPSTRGFASIPTVASLPPMNAREITGNLQLSTPLQQPLPNAARTSTDGYFALPPATNSNASIPKPRPAVAQTASANTSGSARDDHPINWINLPGPELDMSLSPPGVIEQPSPQGVVEQAQHNSTPGASSKLASYSSRISAGDEALISRAATSSHVGYPRMNSSQMPELSPLDLANVFPEQARPDESSLENSKGKKRLSKPGGKLVKKHRWSSSKASAVAV